MIRISIRITLALMMSVAFALCLSACHQGEEGDRCNPLLAAGENECGSGLSCGQPAMCPEAYCCPSDGKSSNPYCQPGCNGGEAAICAADPSECADASTADSSVAGNSNLGAAGATQ
jgi:hypothetical protein